jgi:hypothetical protein
MWNRCVEASLTVLQNDSEMMALLGGKHIYRSRSRASIQIPGVYYSVVGNSLNENYSPVTLQWDIFGRSAQEVSDIEVRLFKLLHSEYPIDFPNSFRAWCQFQNGFDFGESDQNVYHRAVEYRYTPPRENG